MCGNHEYVLFDEIVQEVMTWLKSQLLSTLVGKTEGLVLTPLSWPTQQGPTCRNHRSRLSFFSRAAFRLQHSVVFLKHSSAVWGLS